MPAQHKKLVLAVIDSLKPAMLDLAIEEGRAPALAALVEFQADFAGREPELIVVQDRDLANLPEPARRRVRRLQRTYVEIWVDTLQRLHPGLSDTTARVAAHGAFGLLNSTPHSGRSPQAAALLCRLALAALHSITEPGSAPPRQE